MRWADVLTPAEQRHRWKLMVRLAIIVYAAHALLAAAAVRNLAPHPSGAEWLWAMIAPLPVSVFLGAMWGHLEATARPRHPWFRMKDEA